jgi:transposase
MIIIGVDYHPSFQQIAWIDAGSGESGEQRLQHNEEAEKFYRDLKERGVDVRIGMEAGGHARWSPPDIPWPHWLPRNCHRRKIVASL